MFMKKVILMKCKTKNEMLKSNIQSKLYQNIGQSLLSMQAVPLQNTKFKCIHEKGDFK